MLTQEHLKSVLHYNQLTGVFAWVSSPRNGWIGKRAGNSMKSCYVNIGVCGVLYLAHRLAFLYMKGSIPKEVDHINRVRSDNSWCNLREVTHSENCKNMPEYQNNKSGITGVHYNRQNAKWYAYINIDRKKINIYYGDDFFEACCARKSAEIKHGYL